MKPRRLLFPSPLPPAEMGVPSSARPPALFYFLAALLLIPIIAAAWRTIDDSMLLLHLKAGEVILRNHQVPERDIFSAGSFAQYWMFIQWGWAVVLAQAFKLGEWAGLAVVNVACVSAITGLMIARSRRHGGRWYESLITTGTVLGVLLPGFQPNATGFAFVLWLIALILVESYRLWPMVLLPFVSIVWANVHPAFVLPAVLPLARLALPAPGQDENRRGPSGYLFIIIVACILGALVTPHSINIVQALLTTTGISASETAASWAVLYTTPWAILRAALALLFIAALLANRRAIYGWQIAVGVVLIAACAVSPVALNFLLIYLAAPAARAISHLLSKTWQTRVVRSAAASALLLFVVAATAGAVALSGLRNDAFGTGLRPNTFPETASGRLASLPLRNAILTDAAQGGYVAWRTWPLWKITADMRPTLYDRAFRENYEKLWEGGQGWDEMLNYWRVWAVLGSPDVMRKYPNGNLYYRLADSSEWLPVWWDSHSILYMKTDADLSDSNLQPYRQLKPGLSWSAQAARITTPKQWRELAADLRRVTMEDPTNILAQKFLQQAEAKVAELN